MLLQGDKGLLIYHEAKLLHSNFFGGAFSGIAAAVLGIVNNAPGTASPIPGLLAPFAFNDPMKVVIAMAIAAVGGIVAGFVGSVVFRKLGFGNDEVPVI